MCVYAYMYVYVYVYVNMYVYVNVYVHVWVCRQGSRLPLLCSSRGNRQTGVCVCERETMLTRNGNAKLPTIATQVMTSDILVCL